MKLRTFIAAALIFTMGGFLCAQNAEDFEILQKQDGNVTITGYSGTLPSVVIPSAIFGQTVDAIGSGAFSDNMNLRSVTIPETVVQIGNSAFQGDLNLTKVTFGGGLLNIGDFAFADDALKVINLPSGLISIGNSAFTGNDLSFLIIPDSVLRIGSNAFADNPHLTSIALGANLESVYYNAFGMPDNPVNVITVKRPGIDFSGIDLDQNFINIYNAENGGAGVYNKKGNAWLKSSSDPNSFNPAAYALEMAEAETNPAPSQPPPALGNGGRQPVNSLSSARGNIPPDALDVDGDGYPDAWERAHKDLGFNPNTPNLPYGIDLSLVGAAPPGVTWDGKNTYIVQNDKTGRAYRVYKSSPAVQVVTAITVEPDTEATLLLDGVTLPGGITAENGAKITLRPVGKDNEKPYVNIPSGANATVIIDGVFQENLASVTPPQPGNRPPDTNSNGGVAGAPSGGEPSLADARSARNAARGGSGKAEGFGAGGRLPPPDKNNNEKNNKPAPSNKQPPAKNQPAAKGNGQKAAGANILGKTFVVYFPRNSSSFYDLEPKLVAENSKVFDTLIAALKANPTYKVRISGYVNGINPNAREERTMLVPLSLDRAKTVAAYLNYHGIEKNRIKLGGYGSARPITGKRPNWHLNRRAEITVIE